MAATWRSNREVTCLDSGLVCKADVQNILSLAFLVSKLDAMRGIGCLQGRKQHRIQLSMTWQRSGHEGNLRSMLPPARVGTANQFQHHTGRGITRSVLEHKQRKEVIAQLAKSGEHTLCLIATSRSRQLFQFVHGNDDETAAATD